MVEVKKVIIMLDMGIMVSEDVDMLEVGIDIAAVDGEAMSMLVDMFLRIRVRLSDLASSDRWVGRTAKQYGHYEIDVWRITAAATREEMLRKLSQQWLAHGSPEGMWGLAVWYCCIACFVTRLS